MSSENIIYKIKRMKKVILLSLIFLLIGSCVSQKKCDHKVKKCTKTEKSCCKK